jgi:glycerol-3-phosphate dehydrogenase
MINLLGIESPGITGATAIAKYVTEMISKNIEIRKKDDYKKAKPKLKRFSEMTAQQQSDLIKKDARWGRIVCRCEHITEAEVINALSNPIGAKSLSSVKYRCRAGMGRCQGGFCTQHIVRLLEENFGTNVNDIKLKSPKSYLFSGRTREVKK